MKLPFIKTLTCIALSACFFLCPNYNSPPRALANTNQPVYKPVESKEIKLNLDDKKLNLSANPPIIVNNRVLLPLRIIFEAMGANVEWDQSAKTIKAQRHEESLDLELNSTLAKKNGEAIIMDVPALAYNNRTYVPVRFIGESFGSQVNYFADKKLVAIETDGRNARELRDLEIYLNGIKLTFDPPPILLRGRKYLPLDELLDAIKEILPAKDNFNWYKDANGGYHTIFDRVEKSFSIENPSNLKNKPIIYQEIPYTPFRLIEELLGGQVYLDANGITHIYINRITLKHPFLPLAAPPLIIPTPIPGASLEGNRLLMVSDNPEVLTEKSVPQESATLWLSNKVNSLEASQHRVFGWHVNNLGKDARIGIIIENTGTKALEIFNARSYGRESSNTWGGYDVGLPIADAVLSGLTNKTLDHPTTVMPGESLLLEEYLLPDEHLLGFINDFDLNAITPGQKFEYQVRVVVSTQEDQNLAKIKSPPLALDKNNPHPRGNWAASSLRAEVPQYFAGSPQVCFSISNGSSDNLYSKDASMENGFGVLANPGHFGASYILEIPVYNPGDTPVKISLRLSARGGQYTGAVKTPNGIFLVPNLIAGGDTAELYSYLAPPGESRVKIELFHAGGSSLAVALNILSVE